MIRKIQLITLALVAAATAAPSALAGAGGSSWHPQLSAAAKTAAAPGTSTLASQASLKAASATADPCRNASALCIYGVPRPYGSFAPAAQAGNPVSYIGHPGGPGAAGPVLPTNAAVRTGPSVLQARQQTERALGSTPSVGSVAIVPTPVTEQRGGFDWGDASVAGGFIAGLGLLAVGARTLIRRRGAPA